MRFAPHAEYAFRHPLIRAVAYETQRRPTAWNCIGVWQPLSNNVTLDSLEENAALIAEHYDAADDLPSRFRLAHARRGMGAIPRYQGRAYQLGTGPSGRRPVAHR